MKPYWQDSTRTVYNADAVTALRSMEAESVQMCVTSPPYYGLRKYAGEQDLVWGGENHHEHEWNDMGVKVNRWGKDKNVSEKQSTNAGAECVDVPLGNTCFICGAWRGAFGLEPTVQMYVDHTVEILREIKRVLRKDGVVFWNVGDSYATGAGSGRIMGGKVYGKQNPLLESGQVPNCQPNRMPQPGLKPKDLMLIPFRVVLAAQEDGWYVRSDIIWVKPNPMPESVTDRPTEAHEHILMLTRSERYFWDQEAVREAKAESTIADTRTNDNGHRRERGYPGAQSNGGTNLGGPDGGRNLRSVWEFPTQPYPKAHFATFPEELPERCIKAATPEVGSCPKCGAPWVRVTEKPQPPTDMRNRSNDAKMSFHTQSCGGGQKLQDWYEAHPSKTLGWQPSCKCGLPQEQNVPAVVLDPFAGSGTTLEVATRLARKSVGIELSQEYCDLIIDRNRQHSLFGAEG